MSSFRKLLIEASGRLAGTTDMAHIGARHSDPYETCSNPGCAGNREYIGRVRAALGIGQPKGGHSNA